jgi:hypothetical protein
LGFDALIDCQECRFTITIACGVKLKWKGRTLLGITLSGTLEGPSPWRLIGAAKFKILFFSKTCQVNEPFGDGETPETIAASDPEPELVANLRDPRNWSAAALEQAEISLALRDLDGEEAQGRLLILPSGAVRFGMTSRPRSSSR